VEEGADYSIDVLLQRLILDNDVPWDIKEASYRALQGGSISALFGGVHIPSIIASNTNAQEPSTPTPIIKAPQNTVLNMNSNTRPVIAMPQNASLLPKKPFAAFGSVRLNNESFKTTTSKDAADIPKSDYAETAPQPSYITGIDVTGVPRRIGCFSVQTPQTSLTSFTVRFIAAVLPYNGITERLLKRSCERRNVTRCREKDDDNG
jgi:hypothetical protein